MPAGDAPDHIRRNRELWERWAADYVADGRASWAAAEPRWGIWGVPESLLPVLPERLAGLDTIELGCGTGYVSAWLARRGARPVGLDLTSAQLASARGFQREFGLHFPLVQASAEAVPLASERFDLAISEYGACLWCDPARWVREASRLLRPGGRLIFLVNSPLLMLCMPDAAGAVASDRLVNDHFGMYRIEWSDGTDVEFHLGHADWIRLLGENGFVVEELLDVRPPADATTRYPFVSLAWARRWPCEEVWKVRKCGGKIGGGTQ